jgi:catechol 2,3-dioxygenase-like lactoylglutathione lyase family enzyme/ribosomal protein S18 acetylase RimI-like enzyme
MNLKNLSAVLFVKDIDMSKAFYISVLQQSIDKDFGKNVLFKSGFVIWEIRDNHVIPQLLGLDKIYDKSVNRCELYFETDDLSQVFQNLKSKNVNFVHEIHEEIWGQKTIRFFDPDNHLIEIGESMVHFVLGFHNQGLTMEQISERTYIPVDEIRRLIGGNKTGIRILPACKADLSAILDLQKECYMSEAEIYNDFEIPPLKQDLKSLEDEFDYSFILKGLVDGQIVTSVRGFFDNDTCYIGKLIVKNEFQNRGIGRKMMGCFEAVFRDCKRFELFTGFKSLKNLYLYKKLGYKEFKKERINDGLSLIYLEKYS